VLRARRRRPLPAARVGGSEARDRRRVRARRGRRAGAGAARGPRRPALAAGARAPVDRVRRSIVRRDGRDRRVRRPPRRAAPPHAGGLGQDVRRGVVVRVRLGRRACRSGARPGSGPRAGSMNGARESGWAALVPAACVAAALALAVLPLLGAELPGLIDLPNHVARAAIRERIGDDPFYAAFYRCNPPFIPNAAYDAFAAALSPWLAPPAIARTFTAL